MSGIDRLRRNVARLVLIAAALLAVNSARAQQVTVQQPVVETFGVQTSVLVPDRGTIFLGGVSRAAEARSTFGPYPFRAGSSVGRELHSSGASATVWIHDLAAMDEYLLGLDTGRAPHDLHPAITPRGALMRVDDQRTIHHPPQAAHVPAARRADPVLPAGLRDAASAAEGFYQLGVKAEARGDAAVARVHYQMAAGRGSEAARRRLAQLEGAQSARE